MRLAVQRAAQALPEKTLDIRVRMAHNTKDEIKPMSNNWIIAIRQITVIAGIAIMRPASR